jgi:hypothetical protein
VDGVGHGVSEAFAWVLDTSVTEVSCTALTTAVEALGPGDDGVSVGVGLGFALGDAGTEPDGCGVGLGEQVGDVDGLRRPVPDPRPERDGVEAGALPLWPGPGFPLGGCKFVLLGDTAVEMLIAT